MPTETIVRKKEGEVAGPERTSDRRVYLPPVDIIETKDGLTLLADMPGVEPANIDVQYERGVLTLKARVEPRQEGSMNYLLREYGVGDYHRTFAIGEGIDAARIKAEFKNGVVKLHLPKSEALKPRKIAVKS
jgi:HSP20 family protein